MNDLDGKIAEGIDDEALFRLAEGEEREFSPEYQQSMERLYQKAGAHPRRRMKPIRRIIAIAAIVAVLTGAATAATFWEEIQQFFVTTFGEYVELQTDREREIRREVFAVVPEEWDSFWYPSQDGCEADIISAKLVGMRKEIIFMVGQDEATLYQWTDKRNINADNDADVVRGVYVGEEEAYAIEKGIDGAIYRTIFWSADGVSFELRGAFAFEELSKAAETLVLVER